MDCKNKKQNLFYPILIFSLNIIGAVITFLAPSAKIQVIGLFLILVGNIIGLIHSKRSKV